MKLNPKYTSLFNKLKNPYIIIFLIFAVWMLFWDANSLFIHNDLNNDLKALEKEKDYYIEEIEKDAKGIKTLSDGDGLEKFAREQYYMKKANEEIYVIEYEDSIVKQKNDE